MTKFPEITRDVALYQLKVGSTSFFIQSSSPLETFTPSFLSIPAHIFVQQPTHYTFRHIQRLEECMNHVYDGDNGKQYGDCSLSRSELKELLVCVCR